MDAAATLAATLERYGDLVHDQIRRALDAYASAPAAPADFYGIMRYQFGWANEQLEPVAAEGGKGLRGALLMLVNAAFGGAEATAAPLAAGVEMLHNFSLVHDDIVDHSPTRRHRPTIWSLWGASLGINVGDGLYALAHLALFNSPLRQEAPDRFADIVQQFDQTTLHVCEGQHRDMSFEETPEVAVDAYLRMIGGKSAALIAATAWIGAHAAGAGDEQVQAAYRFGYDLGMAFQMQDDILGIWGDEAVTGKSAVSDIVSRKKTLPVLLAMAHGAAEDTARLRALYTQPGHDGAETADILALLDRAGARDLTRDYLRRYQETAHEALRDMLLPADAHERLEVFMRRFVERSA